MGFHLKAFVGAIHKLAPSAPSVRSRARRLHMASQNSPDSFGAIFDKQTATASPIEGADAVKVVSSDQVPEHTDQTTPYGNDNPGAPSVASSPASPSHDANPPLSPLNELSPVDSSRSDSDENEDTYDMQYDTVRNLRVKGWSPEESRWTTKYHKHSLSALHIDIVSWNVDFMAPDTAGRVACILDHLRKAVLTDEPQATVILLQELDEASFAKILENSWVRKYFAVTPPTTRRWQASYGLATLVSRPAWIANAQMLQFSHTTMGRAALLVDVSLYPPSDWPNGPNHVIRIANTHLESLPMGERARPLQLQAIADMLRAPGVFAGVVGGDMNMIGPADQRIHIAAGLRDAGSDGPESLTWGFQPPSRFPPGRLDRIFYTPSPDFIVKPVKVIGRGLKTKRGQWASDHHGLLTRICLRHDDDDPELDY
ncbi:hypothetical protein DICSQDRAFT_153137 [Dichomitus squalens LYAD-421 SS1]|uniref:Endonuclease/exonuclease/phosphatase n=1 Tax=Dichomitus squalens TaxID=114155 RepID=A0A4Q9MFP4_9APHY|nr:uncharacterized protein DICSQDRAFT_153137 [Dichomitus squalens LYAD-421 SS1]EJF64972.1 hypothetical protein DICSQDRAFT_153137 [Dichomitus squalens LYAD-421 SS1]TBU26214.1 Endonuclease/exonuclease/phosphatase [Dichomitus squalens]